MEFKDLLADHSYYCHTSNYYSNDASFRFDTFDDFYEEMNDLDIDYNMCFRWDIKERISEDYDDDEYTDLIDVYGKYHMEIFIMHQRKGRFVACCIDTIKESDFNKIVEYLEKHHDYMKSIWKPF